MYIAIIVVPLVGAAITLLWGRKIGEEGAGYITTGGLIITSILAINIFKEVGLGGVPVYVKLFTWIDAGQLYVDMGLLYDSVTAVMLIVVTVVSALVHLYSTEYMRGDPHLPRFMSYLSLFTFFMIILVTSDNYLQLFIGWEGVGLCSYLLINFWYTRIQANKSAIKAMVVNRVGDIGLALAMFAIYVTFKSLDFATVFGLAQENKDAVMIFMGTEVHALTLIGILLFVGAVGKSAQLGLHTWLPDAMEGPTPVSALIHAATMVTAGVFLLIRSSPILEYAPGALQVVVVVGALTAFFAATVGLVQNDIKKVIAYSTCSQLGYMVFACGISNYSTSLFHLMNHAFFKALLFLSAGAVIHAMADEQDMRKLGGLLRQIPFTYSMMLIGSLSLMGFPFMTGYYSKDAILELAYANFTLEGSFAHWLGTVSALFTAFYSFRLIYLTFISEPHSSFEHFTHAHESPWRMSLPLVILAFGSIFVGYIFRDMIIGLGTSFFGNGIYVAGHNLSQIDAEFIPTFIKWVPVIFSMTGAVLAMVLYSTAHPHIQYSNLGRQIYTFFNNKWHFDYIYNNFIGKPLINFGYEVSYKVLDRGLIELIGPYGISKQLKESAKMLSKLQSGQIYNYAFGIFVFLTLFITLIGNLTFWAGHLELMLLIPLVIYLNSLHKAV